MRERKASCSIPMSRSIHLKLGYILHRGASIYDIRTQGGGGGHGKADEGNGGCVNVTRWEKGVKKSENFADIISGRPLVASRRKCTAILVKSKLTKHMCI